MKELKVFKNVSKKQTLVTTIFSLALVSSLTMGCASNEVETGYYVAYTGNGKEVVFTEEQYNELMSSNDEEIIIRLYGGTILITKEELQEATYQKEAPSSLQK